MRRQRAGCLRRAERLFSPRRLFFARLCDPPQPAKSAPAHQPGARLRSPRQHPGRSCGLIPPPTGARARWEAPRRPAECNRPPRLVPRLCRPLFGGRASPPPAPTLWIAGRPAPPLGRAAANGGSPPATARHRRQRGPPPRWRRTTCPSCPPTFSTTHSSRGSGSGRLTSRMWWRLARARCAGRVAAGCVGCWPSYNAWRLAAAPPPALLGAGRCTSAAL